MTSGGSRTICIRHAKEYTSLCGLGLGPLLQGASGNNSGAAQPGDPVFASVYVTDKLVKPPNMTERPKSVRTAFSPSSIRTFDLRKDTVKFYWMAK
jgi:hypothetical protein